MVIEVVITNTNKRMMVYKKCLQFKAIFCFCHFGCKQAISSVITLVVVDTHQHYTNTTTTHHPSVELEADHWVNVCMYSQPKRRKK